MKNTLSQFDTTRKKWIGDLHELIACTVLILCLAVELHRVLDGNLDLRLEGQTHQLAQPVAFPTQAAICATCRTQCPNR